jgi:hypothetical protein
VQIELKRVLFGSDSTQQLKILWKLETLKVLKILIDRQQKKRKIYTGM